MIGAELSRSSKISKPVKMIIISNSNHPVVHGLAMTFLLLSKFFTFWSQKSFSVSLCRAKLGIKSSWMFRLYPVPNLISQIYTGCTVLHHVHRMSTKFDDFYMKFLILLANKLYIIWTISIEILKKNIKFGIFD